jgi:hypothetical protein
MKRIASVLAIVAVLCLLRVPDVLAGGGFGIAPPDKTVGPAVKVSIVMEGPQVPNGSTYRQFAMTVDKEQPSPAVIFTGTSNYQYGCLWSGFPNLQSSTEQRFLGFMQNWAPFEVLEALLLQFGEPDLAVIVAVHDISCTPVGDKEYLAFTARVKFAR